MRTLQPAPHFITDDMNVVLYNYNGEYNALPKTLDDGTTLEGVLRDACDVSTPTITVRCQQPFKFNYCYIPSFGKYYFINRVDIIGYDISRLELSSDVLQTYKDAILASSGVVTQRETPNKYLNDRVLKYDIRPQLVKVSFPTTGLFNKEGSIIMVTIKGNL